MRPILKALTNVACVPMLIDVELAIKMLINVPHTMMKSKQFHPEWKYIFPIAIIFKIASTVNIPANM